ncbi:Arylsulfatase [Euzebya pacifica]|uniref:Arylsulfatase n=1 Tax=Euzebya pacifica TaxID=1608957 RepID=A0A346XWP1_9ACTN|nr:Arylsulfatase [Euzebya pacifica]
MLILADDLGYGEIGAYGQDIIRTPRLDRMAEEGIRFTDYYTAAPICAPSRCSLLTGTHQGHATIRHNSFNEGLEQESFSADDVTIAELLSDAGYATALYGKWGFGPDDRYFAHPGDEGDPSHPLQRGFDEFTGFIYHHHATNGYWADYWWEGNERVDIPENANGARGRYTPDDYVGRALDFMRVNAEADQPFFLMLSSQLPHTPNHVPDFSEYDDLPMANDTKKHAAMVTLLDTHVGMVLDQLAELGVADNTLVLFTSDNGPHNETTVYGGTDPIPGPNIFSAGDDIYFNANGPFRGVKQNLYEGGIRVPMIAWGPGLLAPEQQGAVSAHQWAGYDILATIADVAGVSAGAGDGISVKPLLTGGQQQAHEYLYWERFKAGAPTPQYYLNDRGRHGKFVQAVRKGKWKCLRWAPGVARDGSIDITIGGTNPQLVVPVARVPKDAWEVELFDLERDPGETVNRAPANLSLVQELTAHMDHAHQPPAATR